MRRRWRAWAGPSTCRGAAQLQDDKAVWGYYIMDEPTNVQECENYAQRRQALHEADPSQPGYVNLGGSY